MIPMKSRSRSPRVLRAGMPPGLQEDALHQCGQGLRQPQQRLTECPHCPALGGQTWPGWPPWLSSTAPGVDALTSPVKRLHGEKQSDQRVIFGEEEGA